MQKLCCYIDESGQDTEGKIFVVAIIVTEQNRDQLFSICEQLEKLSGKHKDKWGKAKHNKRMRYLRHIFADDRFKDCLRYSTFQQTKDYNSATIKAIFASIKWKEPINKFTTMIYIDGLTKTKRHEYGPRLRHLGLPVRQIRGIAKDESNSLIRLADTIAGFVKDAVENQSEEINNLFRKANKENLLINVKT